MAAKSPSPVVDVGDFWAWYQLALERGWTDGMVVAPPTREKVDQVLAYLGRRADEVIGIVGPKDGLATIEQIAINCVMAGCAPEHVPVVIASIEAMLEPEFNLHGVQSTTNPCAPLVIVNGPVVSELGFHAREGAFGGGSRASACVGRAVRLVLWNIGGGIPGETDMASQGQPAKYAFCAAENMEQSPWQALHVERGFAENDSTVTVFACQSPHPLRVLGNAERILRLIASSIPVPAVNMFHAAGQFLLSFGARPAQELARAGYSKADVKKWVWENARFKVGTLREFGRPRRGAAYALLGPRRSGRARRLDAERRHPAADGARRRHDPCRRDRRRFAMVDGLLAGLGQLWRLCRDQAHQAPALISGNESDMPGHGFHGRRRMLGLLGGLAAGAAARVPAADAQAYPAKPIQLVVPLGPAGINDIISRLIAQKLSESWGQQVVVVNKPGAGGIIGSELVAKAAPDGYTILMVYSSHMVNPSLHASLPYDTLRDFAPITLVNTVNLVLAVGAATPVKSAAELIAAAKARPGQINYGTVGVGSLGHLAGLRFAKAAGIDIVQVPYKSAPEVTSALLSGDVTLYFDSPITALPFIRSGKERALAVTSKTRSSVMPDVPTLDEAVLPGFEVVGWNGLVAPARTPKPIIDKLNAEVVRILHTPEVERSLKDQGVDVVGDTPEQFGDVIRTDVAKWSEIIKAAGLKIE